MHRQSHYGDCGIFDCCSGMAIIFVELVTPFGLAHLHRQHVVHIALALPVPA
jgi:hypothetical protein